VSKEEIKVIKEPDRLAELKDKLEMKKNRGHQLYWIKYNPGADFDYDINDATEDVHWMIYEIKRLREENGHYKEFIDSYKDQIKKELE
jgi:hypothetical protein